MAIASTKRLRIAIQGSGIAAAACAHRLSQRHDVTVFEASRGPGGRMGTRRSEIYRSDQAPYIYRWDHGAQYFIPKTDEFSKVVTEWCKSGLCEPWEARHCCWTAEDGILPDPKAAMSERYVGKPEMDSICKGLLKGIDTRYKVRAEAKRSALSFTWTLRYEKSGKKKKQQKHAGEVLGEYDFLICSDKMAAAQFRRTLDEHYLQDFIDPANAVKSVPGLTLMVATQETNLPFDSLSLKDHRVFSWIARDDSKPGRERPDGTECWILHASSLFNEDFNTYLQINSKKGIGTQKLRTPSRVRAAIVKQLLPRFEALVSTLTGADPIILKAHGHHWGAAVPTTFLDPNIGNPYYLDTGRSFAACGDYFDPCTGSVEGAWISGASLADALLQQQPK